jgi:ubiquinone/menaquinone biosynthesis C-methylase UbiE
MDEKIEILPVGLLDQYQDLVKDLKFLARELRLEFGWHYLLDLTWILSQLEVQRGMFVLDAGAGTGMMQWYLVDRGVEVLSVDRDSRAYLPFRFRRRFKVLGKRPEDLHPTIDALRHQAGKLGLLKSVIGIIREYTLYQPAKQESGSIIIYNQDLAQLVDVPDDSQDAVVAVSSLEHNTPEALQSVIKELMRVIKPGGKLLATLCASREKDWFHEPSKGWCYSEVSLRNLFDLSYVVPSNYDRYDDLFGEMRSCQTLSENLASFYYRSGDNGMPWGIWDPQYQPVGVCKVKRSAG